MQQNEQRFFLDRISTTAFFYVLFIYQIIFIFQGLDFTDEGFYGTFYQQIFKDPSSVQYNFMYWLSGIIGGAWLHLFPRYGLLGLRFGGVLTTILTVIISYCLLKKYLKPWCLKLGLLIAVINISNDPKALFYDNLTALFFVVIIYFLLKGLFEKKLGNLFLCGIFLSLNIFIKLSNLAHCAIGATIFYYAFINKMQMKYVWKQVAALVTGFAITTVIILVIMKLAGHLSIFISCIELVKEMGKSKENTHGIKKLFKLFKYEYSLAVMYGAVTFLIFIFTAFVINKLRFAKTLLLRFIGACIIALFVFYQLKTTFISAYLLLGIITGLSLLAALLIVINDQNIDIKTIAFAGAAMIITLPLGSDFGMLAAGRYALWIALPVAVNYYLNITSFSTVHFITRLKKRDKFTGTLSFFSAIEMQLSNVFAWGSGVSIILLLAIAFTNTWSDSKDRTKMVYQVNSKFTQGIFTTCEKASLINELLTESSKYIKKDDYVLAYNEIPLYYAMTETKPFMHNSWIKLYDREVFETELENDLADKKILPVVIYQKVNSISDKWPCLPGGKKNDINQNNYDLNQPRNFYIKHFLDSNHYKTVWENAAFRIYIPDFYSH